eukprot:TRINITY_DN954_c0_g1_i1.p1 TRINITY_DN954_c0_g1~~TRINITY_DN954_c0_g1_i1.p1  ORF type:complete len:468 (+),score=160.45 TRINITY_DN954_c0_g1_i1:138-1541(+)
MTETKESKLVVIDKELQDLIAENKRLKAQLSKLQRLDEETENKKNPKAANLSLIKSAFEAIDTDKSGFIDRDEFNNLCIELGEILEKDDLTAAIKAIDTSGDGKISLNEFVRWWDDKKTDKKEKKKGKLFLLKAKLRAKYLGETMSKVAKNLVKSKTTSNDLINYRLRVALGEMKEPKAFIHAGLSFAELEKKSMPSESKGVLTAKFSVKDEAECKALKLLAEVILDDKLGDSSMYNIEYDSNFLTFKFLAVPEDPFEDAQKMKLDLKSYLPELSAKIDLANGTHEIFADPTDKSSTSQLKSLPDAFKMGMEFKIQMKKNFMPAVVAATGKTELAFFNFMDKTDVTLNLGEVKDLLEPTLAYRKESSSTLTDMITQMHLGNTPLVMVTQFIDMFAEDSGAGLLEVISTLPRKAMKPLLKKEKYGKILAAVRAALNELTEVELHLESGIKATVKCKDIAVFDRMPTKL